MEISSSLGRAMSRAVELVLEIGSKSAGEPLCEPVARESAAGRMGSDRLQGPAIADRLQRFADVKLVRPREAMTIRSWGRRDDGAQLLLQESPDGKRRRLEASYTVSLSPGLLLRTTVCDALLEPGAALATSDVLPPEFRARLDDAGEWTPSISLTAHCTALVWQAPDGLPVDIALLEASFSSRPERCEFRLTCPLGDARSDDAEHAGHAADVAAESIAAGAGANRAASRRSSDPALQAATAAVFAAARILIERFPAFPTLADAYVDTAAAKPVRAAQVNLAGARTPHDALIAIADNIAHQWFGNERGVRESSDAEFVHQMRVALRRAKTLLKIFPRWADECWKTRVEPGFAWLGDMLGEARDLDVFVDSTLVTLASADGNPAGWSTLAEAADARRIEARLKVQEALHSRRYAQLSVDWLEWLASQRFGSGPAKYGQRSLWRYVAKRARRHFKRLTAEPALTALDAAGRHRRRIEAKRLRYTLEFFQSLVSPNRRRKLAKQVGRIQTVLGEGNDAAAAVRFFDSEHFEATPYQRGFARGWAEAVNRTAAERGEALIRKLRKPKIVGQ